MSIIDTLNNATQTILGTRTINDSNGLGQSQYNFNYRTFPEDLANDYNGHYMVININVPVNASGTSPRGGLYSSTGPLAITPLLNEYSKVDNLRFNPIYSPGTGNQGNQTPNQAETYSLQRSTRRIAESIALHMPSAVIFSGSNIYEDVSLTAIAGGIGKLAASAVGKAAGAAAGAFFGGVGGAVAGASGAGALVNAVGQNIGKAAMLAGYPINPRVEVLFSTTPQRQFVFEVLMAPRSENESENIENIVRTLRFHAAPEIDNFGPVPTFIPPAEFDITFYNKGVVNTHMPQINTCVLERIDLDYAPTGSYATFRNGHPVAIRMSLAFREVEIIHKLRVQQGF